MYDHSVDIKQETAGKILEYIRDRLVILMPYFNRALLYMPAVFTKAADGGDHSRLPETAKAPGTSPAGRQAEEEILPATDGETVTADAGEIIRIFNESENRLARICLHMVFHCVFCHPFRTATLDAVLWDAASDFAAEYSVLGLGVRELELPDDGKRRALAERAVREAGEASAERIYHFLEKKSDEAEELLRQSSLVRMDSHRLWISGDEIRAREIFLSKSAAERLDERVKRWMKVQQTARSEADSARHSMGDQAGSRRDRITDLKRDDYDYSEFLKRFARRTEEVRVNPEEFDYISYTYGLSLYENMPLIEPLEYRDALKISDFVIAIDTSGSCQGYTVRRFLDKTWSLMKNSGIFTERMNLRIIQCDCEIQSEVLITSEEEFDRYMNGIEIAGAGGTDFTPVFDRVDELIRNGEFTDLRGMIYFSDGLGRFPAEKPAYRTAFVFVGKPEETPALPVWAESFILPDASRAPRFE